MADEARSTKLPWIITIGGFVCAIAFIIYTATRPRQPPPAPPPLPAHDVTWREMEPYFAEHPQDDPRHVGGAVLLRAPDDAVTGLPYATALAYCRSLGAQLPPGSAEQAPFRCTR